MSSVSVDVRALVRGSELLGRRGLLRHSGCHALLELAHGLAERARQLRELLGAEEKDPDGERDPEILWSEHRVLLCPRPLLRDAGAAPGSRPTAAATRGATVSRVRCVILIPVFAISSFTFSSECSSLPRAPSLFRGSRRWSRGTGASFLARTRKSSPEGRRSPRRDRRGTIQRTAAFRKGAHHVLTACVGWCVLQSNQLISLSWQYALLLLPCVRPITNFCANLWRR